ERGERAGGAEFLSQRDGECLAALDDAFGRRGGGPDRGDLRLAGGLLPRQRGREPGFGLADPRENLPGLGTGGVLERLEPGVFLGVAAVGGAVRLGGRVFLGRGAPKAIAGVGYGLALPLVLPVPGFQIAGGRLEAAGGGLDLVGGIRCKRVLGGGTAQDAFGHGHGGDRFVEACLCLLGGVPRAAQVPGGAVVLALGLGDLPGRRQPAPCVTERLKGVREPRRSLVGSRDLLRQAGYLRVAFGDAGGAAAGTGGGADVLGVLLAVPTRGDAVRVAPVGADHGGGGEQLPIKRDGFQRRRYRRSGHAGAVFGHQHVGETRPVDWGAGDQEPVAVGFPDFRRIRHHPAVEHARRLKRRLDRRRPVVGDVVGEAHQ